MRLTTTNLRMPRAPRWVDQIPMPLLVALAVLVLAASISAFNHRPASQAPAVPTPALSMAPMIIIQKEAAPVVTPALPTPDLALHQEIEALRQRVSELEAQQAPAQVIHAVEPAPAAQPEPPPPPTPEPAAQPALVAPPQAAPVVVPVQQEQFPKIEKRDIPYTPREGGPSEVDYLNITNAWKQEHCHGSGADEVCT